MLKETYGMTYEEEAEYLREIMVPKLQARVKALEGAVEEYQSALKCAYMDEGCSEDEAIRAVYCLAATEQAGE
jgi:hypothetical protein